jgi:hypothetical protein
VADTAIKLATHEPVSGKYKYKIALLSYTHCGLFLVFYFSRVQLCSAFLNPVGPLFSILFVSVEFFFLITGTSKNSPLTGNVHPSPFLLPAHSCPRLSS